MANFVFENYNSMPEQVEENKKNIKELVKYIKPVYNTQTSLTTSTTTIAIASTNAPSDATMGWLMDENGLLFHITSGDGTNLLLEYYASIKGPTGATGATGATGNGITSITLLSTSGNVDTYQILYTNGNTTTFTVTNGIDGINGTDGKSIFYTGSTFILNDYVTINRSNIQPIDVTISNGCMILDRDYMVGRVTNVSGNDITILGVNYLIDDSNIWANKVWSSQKTNNEIQHTFKSTTDATYTDGEYRLDKTYISGTPTNNDIVLYVDNDGKVAKIYQITNAISYTYVVMNLLGEYGGGKTLYQHNITFYNTTSTDYRLRVHLQIINDDATPIDNYSKLATWLYSKGFVSNNVNYMCEGYFDARNVGVDGWIDGIYSNDGTNVQIHKYTTDNVGTNEQIISTVSATFSEIILTL